MMDKLLCPHGLPVTQGRRLGIIVYEHEDKKLCPLLHQGDSLEAVSLNLENNFTEFNEDMKFERNIKALEDKEHWAKIMNPTVIKLLAMKGDSEKIIKFFRDRKKVIDDRKIVELIIKTFGVTGERILEAIGINVDGVFFKPQTTIDLGITIKSKYDIAMEKLKESKEMRKMKELEL